MTTPETPENALENTKGCLKIGCLGLLGIVVVGVAITLIGSWAGSSGEDTYIPNAEHAASACEDNVSQQLKAPATAEFEIVSNTSTGQNTWKITGTVDAENSFGANVRTAWSCDATYDNSREVYSTNSQLAD